MNLQPSWETAGPPVGEKWAGGEISLYLLTLEGHCLLPVIGRQKYPECQPSSAGAGARAMGERAVSAQPG